MSKPLPVHRFPDTRTRRDRAKLEKFGIRAYESRHLLLFTDLDPEIAGTLPPLIDQAFAAWQAYFGELAPNPEQTDFQITGYLLVDRQRFLESGLLTPQDLPTSMHGRQRGAEFWMHDQQDAYYRRHLLIHEGTHCFMHAAAHPPVPEWYIEGMAELFGTHQLDPTGGAKFRVLPQNSADFRGWGRIRMIQDEIAAGKTRDFAALQRIPADAALKNEDYAWSWALCKFLDTHPRYRETFQKLATGLYQGAWEQDSEKLWAATRRDDFREEWLLFTTNLLQGYDLEGAAIAFQPGQALAPGATASVRISANRGWQSGNVALKKGTRYRVSAGGRFTLGQDPKPWESEPPGISFRYFNGTPLGMLLAAVHREPPGSDPLNSLLNVIPVGLQAEFTATETGTIYFRVNDLWSELADNQGEVTVEIQQSPD